MTMSKTMTKYFDDLFKAEFGYEKDADFVTQCYSKPNADEVIRLLKRALTWKSHKNLGAVCEYLGAETDERTSTVKGCKEIIKEDLDYWRQK